FLIILVATISNQTVHVNALTLPSPLKQLESGIAILDVKCNESFILVIKESNGNPSCVKPTTATRLLSHGWITVEKFGTTFQFLNHNNIKSVIVHENNTTSSDNN